jgi:hypothetical protein
MNPDVRTGRHRAFAICSHLNPIDPAEYPRECEPSAEELLRERWPSPSLDRKARATPPAFPAPGCNEVVVKETAHRLPGAPGATDDVPVKLPGSLRQPDTQVAALAGQVDTLRPKKDSVRAVRRKASEGSTTG